MMMKRIKHSSLGDYITTLCFFGLTILSFVKANEVLNEEDAVKALALFSLSGLFFLAALRFIIAKIFYYVRSTFSNKP